MLDPRGWVASPATGAARMYKYRDPRHLYGPIAAASLDVMHGTVKIKGRGSDLGQSLVTMPTAVEVVIVDGGARWCARFGGTIQATAGKRFTATKAPAPTVCAS